MWVVWRRGKEIIKDVWSGETEGGDHKRCGECGDEGREILKDMWSVETGGGDHKRCGECGDGGRRS